MNVEAGDEVQNGLLEFADGSSATLNGQAMVIGSFRMDNGRLYTILRVFRSYGNSTITVTVPPGTSPKSKFEVVTPAAIAGVVGTIFRVEYRRHSRDDETRFRVVSGSINVSGPYCQPVRVEPSSGTLQVRVPTQPCQEIPSWRPPRNGRGGSSS